MKTLLFLAVLLPVIAVSQYKKVEKWESLSGDIVAVGDTFTMGSASGQNDQYLYVHSKPNAFIEPTYLRAGFDGKEFKIYQILVDKNNEKDGFLIFKYGLAKFMVQGNMALKTGEVIVN